MFLSLTFAHLRIKFRAPCRLSKCSSREQQTASASEGQYLNSIYRFGLVVGVNGAGRRKPGNQEEPCHPDTQECDFSGKQVPLGFFFFFPFDLKINTSLHTPWLCTVGSLKSHLPIPCKNSTSNDDGQSPETTSRQVFFPQ